MIRNIVFDIGMVLKGWHPELGFLGDPAAEAVVRKAIWQSGYWEEMDLGVIPEEEILKLMIGIAPEREEEIRYVFNHLELVSERFDYAIAWVKEMKSLGYNVYYLSNYSHHLRKTVPQTVGFLEYMDGGVFSYEVKLVKPDPEIYRALCEKYDLIPEECFFIDDRRENVEAAIDFGMQSMQFEDYAKSYSRIMNYLEMERE